MDVTIFLHIANIIYLASYLVRDILLLRVLTIIAMSCLMPYFFFQDKPMYPAIAWNLLFAAINIHRIILLCAERRPVYFNERDQKLYNSSFSALTPQQFNKLIKIATWQEGKAEECLFECGCVINQFLVLGEGAIEIKRSGEVISRRVSGDFVGESCLITEDPIKADIEVSEDVQYAVWTGEALKKLLDDDPGLHASFQRVISQFLIKQLEPIQ